VKQAVVEALESALALGDHAKAEELYAFVDSIPLASASPYMAAQVQRLRARTAGDSEGLLAAAQEFRQIGTPFWTATTLLEHAELTGDAASRRESLETFERLGATPWIERAAATPRAEIVA
jgi:hypothetical protein